jgi:hypothetical protein
MSGSRCHFSLSLHNVEDLLDERGSMSAMKRCGSGVTGLGRCSRPKIRKRHVEGMRAIHLRWHIDEVFVKINGE